jgi:hypothetical protein
LGSAWSVNMEQIHILSPICEKEWKCSKVISSFSAACTDLICLLIMTVMEKKWLVCCSLIWLLTLGDLNLESHVWVELTWLTWINLIRSRWSIVMVQRLRMAWVWGDSSYFIAAICQESDWVSFPSLWQNTWDNQLKGGHVYFGSLLQKFLPMVIWHYCFGPAETQYVMVGACDRGGLLISGCKERDRKGLGSQCPLQGLTPNELTSFCTTLKVLPQTGTNSTHRPLEDTPGLHYSYGGQCKKHSAWVCSHD